MHRPLWLQCAAASVNKQVWDVLPYKAVLERPAVAQPKRAKPADALPSPTDDDPWAAQPVRIPSLVLSQPGLEALLPAHTAALARAAAATCGQGRADGLPTAEGFGFRRGAAQLVGSGAVCRVRAAAGSRCCAQRAAGARVGALPPEARQRHGRAHRRVRHARQALHDRLRGRRRTALVYKRETAAHARTHARTHSPPVP